MSDLLVSLLALAVLGIGALVLVRWVRADALASMPRQHATRSRERREPGRRGATGLSIRGSAVAELGVSSRR